ncbi:hypothetical protein U9M48_008281 [Paspalum notatum var. saurae]|uniref:Uncharacterized protein n=1 Tax=Paspalum notatum var. saurae TaxID=547442 RepID=A0AAQ3SPQ2_PASNO
MLAAVVGCSLKIAIAAFAAGGHPIPSSIIDSTRAFTPIWLPVLLSPSIVSTPSLAPTDAIRSGQIPVRGMVFSRRHQTHRFTSTRSNQTPRSGLNGTGEDHQIGLPICCPNIKQITICFLHCHGTLVNEIDCSSQILNRSIESFDFLDIYYTYV